jgi:hypothetical protein
VLPGSEYIAISMARLDDAAQYRRGASLAAETATGFKKRSGWLVPSDSCAIDGAKRDWLGKESIITRFRRLLLRRRVFGIRYATTRG